MHGSNLVRGGLVSAALRLTWRAFRRAWLGMLSGPVVLVVLGILLFAGVTLARSALWGLLKPLNLSTDAGARAAIAVLLVAIVLAFGVTSLASPVIAILTGDAVRRGHGSLWSALLAVGRRLLPVLATLLLYWVAIVALAVLSALLLPLALLLLPAALVATIVWIWKPGWRHTWFRRVLVAILPAGPVVYNAVRWALSVPAAAIEGAWPRAAFRASARRVGGLWFTVAGLILAANLIGSLVPVVADSVMGRLGAQARLGTDVVLALALGWLPAAMAAAIYLLRGEGGEGLAVDLAPAPVRPLAGVAVLTFAVPRRPFAVATSLALVLASWMAQPVLAAAPPGAAPASGTTLTRTGLATCTGAPVVAFAPGSPEVAGTLVSISDSYDLPGCGSPEYQVEIAPPGGPAAVVADYPATLPYHWDTTHLAGGVYTVTINLKDATSTTPTYDQTGSAAFTVTAYTACTSPGLTFAPPSPVTPGSSVTFTASSSVCPSPVYQFSLTTPSSGPTVVQAYSAASTYALNTTGFTPGTYQVQVQARNANAAVTDAYDVQKSVSLVVGSCSAATISPAVASPQLVGASVTFNAAALACSGPTYQFSVTPPGGTATVAQAYSSTASFSWATTGLAAGVYTVAVDVHTTGAGTPSFHAETPYTIDVPCTSVAITSENPYGEAPPGPITFSATAGGCVDPLFQYQVASGAGFRAYDPSGNWTWDASAVAPGLHQVTVSVVSAASGTTTAEAQHTFYYRIDPIPTTVTVTGNPGTTVNYTQPATFIASVLGANGQAPPNGDQVRFTLDSFPSVLVPISGGQATFDLSPYWTSLFPGSTVHSLSASFNGDSTYAPGFTPATQFTVAPAVTVTTITSVTADTTPGLTQLGEQYFSVHGTLTNNPGGTLAGTATSTVEVLVDGSPDGPYRYDDVNGSLSVYTFNPIVAGTHTVQLEFLGDSIQGPSTSAPYTVTVPGDPTRIRVTGYTPHIYYGQCCLVFNAFITKTDPNGPPPTGTVTFYDGSNVVGSANISNGSGSSGAIYLTATTHAIQAVYSGDALMLPSSTYVSDPNTGAVTINVQPPPTSIASFTSDTTTGGAGVPVTFTVQVQALVGTVNDGQVQLQIQNPSANPSNYYVFGPVVNNVATIVVSNFAASASNYSVTATFPAPGSTSNYLLSLPSNPISISAPIAPTAISISAPTVQFGTDAQVCLTVVGVGGGIAPTTTATLTIAGTPYTNGVPASGSFCVTLIQPAIGTYVLSGSFAGDANYGPSSSSPPLTTLTVTQRTPTFNVAATPNPVAPTLTSAIAGSVTGLANPAPTGTVTLTDGLISYGSPALDSADNFTQNVSFLTEGTHTITATYSGDTYYTGASSTFTLTVARATPNVNISSFDNPIITGPVNVNAFLDQPLGIAPTGTASLDDVTNGGPPGTVLETVALVGGAAVFNTSLGGIGDHLLTVDYSGDTLYAPNSSAPFTITVNPAATELAVSVPANPTFGTTVDIGAAVSAPLETISPTGSITLTILETGNSCTIDASAQNGSCSLDWGTAGPVTLDVNYSGDAVYAPLDIQQSITVAPEPGTINVVAPSTWIVNQPVTLTWTTTGPPAGDGNINVDVEPGALGCSGMMLADSCTFTPTSTGGYTIDFSYVGDSNFSIPDVLLNPSVGTLLGCYTLNVLVTPTGAGTAGPADAGNCNNGAGWIQGTTVQLTETPAAGYVFNHWDSQVDSNYQVVVNAPTLVIATFAHQCFNLQLTPGVGTSATQGSFVEAMSPQPNCGPAATFDSSGNWNGLYTTGTVVTVEARPGSDANGPLAVYRMEVGRNSMGAVSSVDVTMSSDQSVYAIFGPPCYDLTLQQPAGGGTLQVTPDQPSCLFAPGYPRGTDMLLTATPSYQAGHVEGDYWLNDWLVKTTIENPDGSETTSLLPDTVNPPPIPNQPGPNVILRHVTLTRDTVFGGDFAHCVQLTIHTVELGAVTASPAPNCPIAGNGWYIAGTQVTLTAAGVYTGGDTTQPLHWDGATVLPSILATVEGLPTSNLAAVTMDQDRTVTTTFMDPAHCSPLTYSGVGNGDVSVAWQSNCLPGQVEDGSPVVMVATGNLAGEVMGFTIEGLTDVHGNPAVIVLHGQPAIWVKSGGTAPIRITGWFCGSLDVQATVSTPYGSLDASALGLNVSGFVHPQPAPNCPLAPFAWVIPAGAQTAPAITLSRNDDPPTFAVTQMTDPAQPWLVPQLFTGALDFSFPAGQFAQTLNIAVSMTCFVLTTDANTTASPAENCPLAPANAGAYIPGTIVHLHSQDLSTTGRYEFVNWTDTDGYQQLDSVVQMSANRNPRVTWGDLADLSYALAKGGQELVQAVSPTLGIVTGGLDAITNAIGLNYVVDQVANWGPVNTFLNDDLTVLSTYEIPGLNVTPDTLMVGLYTGGVGGVLLVAGATELDNYLGSHGDGQPLAPLLAAGGVKTGVLSCELGTATGGESAIANSADSMSSCILGKVDKLNNSLPQWGMTPYQPPQLPGT